MRVRHKAGRFVSVRGDWYEYCSELRLPRSYQMVVMYFAERVSEGTTNVCRGGVDAHARLCGVSYTYMARVMKALRLAGIIRRAVPWMDFDDAGVGYVVSPYVACGNMVSARRRVSMQIAWDAGKMGAVGDADVFGATPLPP